MDTEKLEQIKKTARLNGFVDCRIAPWGGFSILVLFAVYAPAQFVEPGRIGISAYYIASNRGYENAGKVADALAALGIPAKRDSSLPAQSAALASGGWIGKNGFYYHPDFGSLVHIQTILLDEKADDVPAVRDQKCNGCTKCMNACPTGAITEFGVDYSRCLRNHMNSVIPNEMKPYVYQLYGCEKCQAACPFNKSVNSCVYSFDLEKTIKGETLPELQSLAGKNMARYVRTINQAILYAANAGNDSVAPVILKLADDGRFADACRYYLATQKKKD